MFWLPIRLPSGFDGVEPYLPTHRRPPRLCASALIQNLHRLRAAGVREIARLTGYSPAHVCYARRGLRISRPLRAKMRELGLKFEEGK